MYDENIAIMESTLSFIQSLLFIAEKLLNYDNGHDNIIPTYEKTYFVAIFCVGVGSGNQKPRCSCRLGMGN